MPAGWRVLPTMTPVAVFAWAARRGEQAREAAEIAKNQRYAPCLPTIIRACPVSGVFAILRLYYAKYFSVVYEFPPVHASTSDFRPLARSFPPSCGHTHPLLSPDLCVVGG